MCVTHYVNRLFVELQDRLPLCDFNVITLSELPVFIQSRFSDKLIELDIYKSFYCISDDVNEHINTVNNGRMRLTQPSSTIDNILVIVLLDKDCDSTTDSTVLRTRVFFPYLTGIILKVDGTYKFMAPYSNIDNNNNKDRQCIVHSEANSNFIALLRLSGFVCSIGHIDSYVVIGDYTGKYVYQKIEKYNTYAV